MYGNAAYDLSRFEAKPKTESKPKLKKVSVKKQKKAVSLKLSPVMFVFGALLVVSVSALMIYTSVMITETTAKITKVNKEITTLQSETVRLDSELNAIMSRGSIEEKALSLGMYQAGKLQVECVEVNKGDKVEILEDDRNIFQKIGDFFSQIF